MKELLPCPFCGETLNGVTLKYKGDDRSKDITRYWHLVDRERECFIAEHTASVSQKDVELWNTRYSKYPLAPVSPILDYILNSHCFLTDEAEADLGEIEHKGEKVMVKIKVVREGK